MRDADGRPLPRQPLRVVMGERDLDPGRRILDDAAETVHLRTRDPEAALKELFARDRQHVFLEGGPTLAAAFLRAGLVDEVVAYVAPMLLGSGRSAVADLGITTIAEALHLPVTDVTVLAPLARRGRHRRTHHHDPVAEPSRPEKDLNVHRDRRGARHGRGARDQSDAVRLTVRATTVLADAGLGDSISVNGCCLTVARAHSTRRGPPT